MVIAPNDLVEPVVYVQDDLALLAAVFPGVTKQLLL